MTAVDAGREAIAGTNAPAALRRAAVLTWLELPRLLGAGVVLLASAVPLAVALLWAAPWWLAAAAALPPVLLLTGLSRIAADVADGRRARMRRLADVDPVLAVLLLAPVAGGERLVAAGGGALAAGCLLIAAAGLLAAPSLAYGAVRGRRGVAAMRGGAILAVWRPGAALSLLSLGCLGAFAVVASAGVLALAVPALLATAGAVLVSAQLAESGAAR